MQIMKRSKSHWPRNFIFLFILYFPSYFSYSNDVSQFPLRHIFTNLEFVTSEQLFNKSDNSLIVDVRSKFEYEILHIKGAVNIPIANMDFITSLKSATERDTRTIVFYCNGIDCKKSYHAAIKARTYNFLNVKVYDSGILEWAKKYPQNSILFGKQMYSKYDLISDEVFFKHNLSSIEFMNMIGDKVWIIDIREPFQRDIKILKNVTYVTSIDKFNTLLSRAKNDNVKLMIYDAVGRQVRWIQYLLENERFKDYYFLKGGVKNFVRERENKKFKLE